MLTIFQPVIILCQSIYLKKKMKYCFDRALSREKNDASILQTWQLLMRNQIVGDDDVRFSQKSNSLEKKVLLHLELDTSTKAN